MSFSRQRFSSMYLCAMSTNQEPPGTYSPIRTPVSDAEICSIQGLTFQATFTSHLSRLSEWSIFRRLSFPLGVGPLRNTVVQLWILSSPWLQLSGKNEWENRGKGNTNTHTHTRWRTECKVNSSEEAQKKAVFDVFGVRFFVGDGRLEWGVEEEWKPVRRTELNKILTGQQLY